MIKIILIYPLFFVSFTAFSCELTDEYKLLSEENLHWMTNDYKKCTKSVTEANFWYQMAQCEKSGDGKDVGSGCHHLMGKSLVSLDKRFGTTIKAKHCQVFIKSDMEIKKSLMEYAIYKKVDKCKKT